MCKKLSKNDDSSQQMTDLQQIKQLLIKKENLEILNVWYRLAKTQQHISIQKLQITTYMKNLEI